MIVHKIYNDLNKLKYANNDRACLIKFVEEVECMLLQLESLSEEVNSYILYTLILIKWLESIIREMLQEEEKIEKNERMKILKNKLRVKVRKKRKITNFNSVYA